MPSNYWIILLIIIVIILIIILICQVHYEHIKTPHEIFHPSLYSTKFNENLFVPKLEVQSSYNKKVSEGYNIMKESKISFIGLAYNIGGKVHKLIKKCQRLREKWGDAQCVIYCYDSTDETYNILNQNKPDWLILPTDLIEGKSKMRRLIRMAHLRNLCLKYIRPDDDYVMIVDWDLSGPISIDGIADSTYYIHHHHYDVLCANGLLTFLGLNMHTVAGGWWYYDPFAVKFLNGKRAHEDKVKRFTDLVYMRGEEPVEVISGFGGAALYRAELFTQDKYSYDTTIDECEHVVIHEKMYKDQNKIGINPSLILLSGVQGGS